MRAVAVVPEWQTRLLCLECHHTFLDYLCENTRQMRDLAGFVRQLRGSGRLPTLLRAVLKMGNIINDGNPSYGNAAGFKLAAGAPTLLEDLVNKRSKVQGMGGYSYLHFVVEQVETRSFKPNPKP